MARVAALNERSLSPCLSLLVPTTRVSDQEEGVREGRGGGEDERPCSEYEDM